MNRSSVLGMILTIAVQPILMGLLVASVQSTPTTWNVSRVDPQEHVGIYSSLALDSANNPHTSYHDWTNDDLKYVPTYTIIQLTNNSYYDVAPQIDGGQVTWYGSDGSTLEIFLYDYASATTTQITSNSYHDQYPQIDGGQVTWYGFDGNDYEIFLYDYASATTTQITSNSYDDAYPEIDGGQVTWEVWDGSDYEIFLATAISSDFSVSVSPPSQTVAAGGSTSHTVTVTLLAGTPESVSLSLNLPPSVGAYTFTPQSGTPTFTSTLVITTLNTAAPGTYNLTVTATGMGTTKTTTLTLTVTPLKLTLSLSPQTVARGSSLTISGQLTPGHATTIRLYYRYPHQTGVWKLATTMNTNSAGFYSVTTTVPNWLAPGDYDLVAVWFDTATGTYTASPITLLTIT